ncbi:unnamed protein product, partial [Polarella glacialis]
MSILGMGNPLLDISAVVTQETYDKYGLLPGNAILAEEKHMPLYAELAAKPDVKYIAGGATQNSIRVAQWMLQEPNMTAYMGCIGSDKFGEALTDACKQDGVLAKYMVDPSAPTGTCAVTILDKERSLTTNLSAANNYKVSHLQQAENLAVLEGAKVVYSAGFFITVSPESMEVASQAMLKSGGAYCMNLSAPFIVQVPPFRAVLEKLLPACDYLFGNETEAVAYAEAAGWDTTDVESIANRLSLVPMAGNKPARKVVITQGAEPTIVAIEGKATKYPVNQLSKEQLVDTNGAGDAFVGGFLAALIKGKDIAASCKAGAWAASIVIQHSGCTYPAKPDYTICMGNPLLDISAVVTQETYDKYGLLPGNAVLAEEKHMPLYAELAAKPDVKYIAGGATQNSIRVAQWMLQEPNMTAYMGCIGSDKFGEALTDACKQDGVLAKYMVDPSAPTGTCAVTILDKERSLTTNLSTANNYKVSHLQQAKNLAVLEGAKVVYSAGFFITVSLESMEVASQAMLKSGGAYCMNLSAPFIVQVPPFRAVLEKLLPACDYLFGNETEVVITQGAEPTIVAIEGKATKYPVNQLSKEQLVDTNGVGDAFVGGFLAALIKGKDVAASCKAGSYAASIVIQHSGCTYPAKPHYTDWMVCIDGKGNMDLNPLESTLLKAIHEKLAEVDLLKQGLGWTHTSKSATPAGAAAAAAAAAGTPAAELLLGIVRCVSQILIANPDTLHTLCKDSARVLLWKDGSNVNDLAEDTPSDERPGPEGIVARLPLILRALASVCTASSDCSGAEAQLPAAATLLRLLEGSTARSSRFRVGKSVDLVFVLTAAADAERQEGAYPATLAALELIRALLEECPAELLVLPWAAHADLALPAFTRPGRSTSCPSASTGKSPEAVEEALGPLLDFTFGTCFSRCNFWPCRTPSDRWAVSVACIRVATALLPALQCFNWPESASIASASEEREGLSGAVLSLRAMQLKVLRCWGEVSFVPTLLQCLLCDVAFGPGSSPVPASESIGSRHFVGFKSPALESEVGARSGAPEPGTGAVLLGFGGTGPATASRLVSTALECFHGLVSLALGPAGFAPHYLPLVQHLLELSATRESLGPLASAGSSSGEALTLRRADLVQSLYAHVSCTSELVVARWAADTLVAVCALWCRSEMWLPAVARAQPVSSSTGPSLGASSLPVQRRALLLSFLSVPAAFLSDSPAAGASSVAAPTVSATRPKLLSVHLARRILQVFPDSSQPLGFRCACADLCRMALASQPGLLLEQGSEMLPLASQACCQTLAELLRVTDTNLATDRELRSRMLLASVSLLDDLVGLPGDTVLAQSFSKPVEAKSSSSSSGGGDSKKQYQSTWELLGDVVSKLLRPWLRNGSPPWASTAAASRGESSTAAAPEAFLALAAILRLVERGCSKAEAVLSSNAATHGHLISLLKDLLSPGSMDLWLPDMGAVQEPAADGMGDYEMLRHPYGPTDAKPGPKVAVVGPLRASRASLERFQGLLAKLRLRREVLAPNRNAAASASTGSSSAVSTSLSGALVPKGFRCWGELCEVACGDALEPAFPLGHGRVPLRQTLPQERVGAFGTLAGAAAMLSGSDILDAFVVGSHLSSLHPRSVRLAAACAASSSREIQDGTGSLMEDLRSLIKEIPIVSSAQAAAAASTLALEAFDDLVQSGAQLCAREKTVGGSSVTAPLKGILPNLLLGLVQQLFNGMQHLGLLVDNAPFFARLLGLSTHLLALGPHGAALSTHSKAVGAFDVLCPPGSSVPPKGHLWELLTRETPAGLALVKQLTGALRACAPRLAQGHHLPPRASTLLAAAGASAAGSSASDSSLADGGGLAEVTLYSLSLLMQLVPALSRRPRLSGGLAAASEVAQEKAESSFQALPLLMELLEALAELLDCLQASEQVAETALHAQAVTSSNSQKQAWQAAAADAQAAAAGQGEGGPVPGWPARAPVIVAHGSSATQGQASIKLLRTPEDAVARDAVETQAEKLDHVLRSGMTCLVLTLAERVLKAIRDREGSGGNPRSKTESGGVTALSSRCAGILQRVLLPRLLSCNFSVFSPSLDVAFSRPSWARFLEQSRAPATVAAWNRATEASWACRLDAVLNLLLGVAQTAPGAALLAEQRAFILLAYCPLLRFGALPPQDSGQFPAAYVMPVATGDAAQGIVAPSRAAALAPWRRPLHASWCRALLLASTMLASAPQLAGEAQVFLQAYAPRLRYVFHYGLQTGHMAVLEEASLACRLLALMSGKCPLAESLVAEAATRALVFVVGSCLTERSTASEVFLPTSGDERIAAKVAIDCESAPAVVPSVFHQRVEYLSLGLLRNVLFALLRIASSPLWLGGAAAVAAWPASKAAVVNASAPGWPTTSQSVFGLRTSGSGISSADSGDPARIWSAVMDVALEGARKVVEILSSLQSQVQASRMLVESCAQPGNDTSAFEGESPWLPLSLSLVGLEEVSSPSGAQDGVRGGASPANLARGLTPMAAPRSPSRMASALSPPLSPLDSSGARGSKRRSSQAPQPVNTGLRYRWAARRPHAVLGGQLAPGAAPEGVTLFELRSLCGSILEMSCTLLCRFCQVTRSSISGGTRSSPAAGVLHGLLFLHELLDTAQPGSVGLDNSVIDYLGELSSGLRAAQNLGMQEAEVSQSGLLPNPAFDGDVYTVIQPPEELETEELMYLSMTTSKPVFKEFVVDDDSWDIGRNKKRNMHRAGKERGYLVRVEADLHARVVPWFKVACKILVSDEVCSKVDVDEACNVKKQKKLLSKPRDIALGANECRVETLMRCYHVASGPGFKVEVCCDQVRQSIHFFTNHRAMPIVEWHAYLSEAVERAYGQVFSCLSSRSCSTDCPGDAGDQVAQLGRVREVLVAPARQDAQFAEEEEWASALMGAGLEEENKENEDDRLQCAVDESKLK